jgi:hypothetical protein
LILKINSSGTIVGKKTIEAITEIMQKSIVTTSDGNYIIEESSTSNISGDKKSKYNYKFYRHLVISKK